MSPDNIRVTCKIIDISFKSTKQQTHGTDVDSLHLNYPYIAKKIIFGLHNFRKFNSLSEFGWIVAVAPKPKFYILTTPKLNYPHEKDIPGKKIIITWLFLDRLIETVCNYEICEILESIANNSIIRLINYIL